MLTFLAATQTDKDLDTVGSTLLLVHCAIRKNSMLDGCFAARNLCIWFRLWHPYTRTRTRTRPAAPSFSLAIATPPEEDFWVCLFSVRTLVCTHVSRPRFQYNHASSLMTLMPLSRLEDVHGDVPLQPGVQGLVYRA